MDYECCYNCQLCDKTCGYCCMIRAINIDDPYSDWCKSYTPANDTDAVRSGE